MVAVDTTPGFSLNEWFQNFMYDAISRVIGALVRLFTILIGLIFIVLTLIVSSLLTFTLILFPVYWFLRLTHENYVATLNSFFREKHKLADAWQFLIKSKFGRFFIPRIEIDETELKTLNELVARHGGATAMINTLESFWRELFKIPPIKSFFVEDYIEENDLVAVARWFITAEEATELRLRFWETENLSKIKAIGKDWAFGYTLNLDKYSYEVGDAARFRKDIMGRDEEIKKLEEILSKDVKKNVILVGPVGCGKKTIVEALAKKIALGLTNIQLAYKRVLFFDVNALISQKDTPEERRKLLSDALLEATEAENIILVINNFDRFAADAPGRVNLTPVFAETLAKNKVKIIGIVSLDAFHKFIMPSENVTRVFEILEVEAISKNKANDILFNIFGREKKKILSYFAIREIVDKSDLLITDAPFPEKAINLADEIVASAGELVITRAVVDKFLSEKLKVPVGKLSPVERNALLNLEATMKKRLVGQTAAVKKIVAAMQRGRLEIGARKKPFGSFLFLGPTGVGKTECAKALAESYFGSEENIIRFDMSEYQDISKLEDFIGSSKTETYGVLIERVKENPFAILLLDEIEKANKNILNIFLTVLDEGYLTDFKGNKVSFEHQIVIGTSNAGAILINRLLKDEVNFSEIEKQVFDSVITEGTFSPEFLNRFDAVVCFSPLERQELSQIAQMQLKKLNDELYAKHRIRFKITPELVGKVVELGYSPEFGARPMRRVIDEQVATKIAKILLEGKARAGEEVMLSF